MATDKKGELEAKIAMSTVGRSVAIARGEVSIISEYDAQIRALYEELRELN